MPGIGCAVVVDHREAEADGEEQARRSCRNGRCLAAGGGECGFDAVPDDEDGGEHAEEVLAHGVEEAEVLREQVVDGLKDELQEIGSACRSAPSTWVLGIPPYGMRKFWSESVRVPVTWAMFPARVAWRSMSALMALVVVSRCCLARMVWLQEAKRGVCWNPERSAGLERSRR